MRNIKFIGTILIILGILVTVKILFLSHKESTPGMASGKNPASPVSVYVATTEELNNIVYATGTLMANEVVTLLPEISGKIVFLHTPEGAKVNKGDLLVKINDADFQAQLRKLELQKQIAVEKAGRLKQLLEVNGVSKEEYDMAENVVNTTAADIEFVKSQILKTEIRAPFSGKLGLRNVSEGSFITPSTSITTIQQINPVKIDFSVPEKYAGLLRINDTINFVIDGIDRKCYARIYAIEPNINQATRTIQLRALAENSKGDLLPGAFARIELPLAKIKNAIMIPTESIIPVLKGKKVFLCRNGKAQESMVETGVRTDTRIQVLTGVAPGDSVLTTGIMQIKSGTKVKIVVRDN